MKIEKIEKYSDSLLIDINELMPQLSSSAQLLDRETLTSIIESEANHLLVAVQDSGVPGKSAHTDGYAYRNTQGAGCV